MIIRRDYPVYWPLTEPRAGSPGDGGVLGYYGPDWKEHPATVAETTGYVERTVKNIKYVGENIAPSRLREDVDFSLYSEVAPLPAKEQSYGSLGSRKPTEACRPQRAVSGAASWNGPSINIRRPLISSIHYP